MSRQKHHGVPSKGKKQLPQAVVGRHEGMVLAWFKDSIELRRILAKKKLKFADPVQSDQWICLHEDTAYLAKASQIEFLA